MLKKWAYLYVNERRARGEMTKNTADQAWYCVTGFADSFGKRPLTQLTPRAIEAWLADHSEWKPSTRVTQFGMLRSFCNWMLERGCIDKDPFRGLKPPKRPKRSPRPLARRDYEALLLVLPDSRARLISALMYWFGLRCVSVSKLNVEDFDRYAKLVHVEATKGGLPQMLPLLPEVELALNGYLRDHPASSGPLIRSYNQPGKRLTEGTIGDLVGQWNKDAGLKTHAFDGRGAHVWRHTAASELAEATRDPYLVQELLGHADVSTSMWYVKRASTERLLAGMTSRTAMADASK